MIQILVSIFGFHCSIFTFFAIEVTLKKGPEILYRGVDKVHPSYELALKGIAPARGTERNPRVHNVLDTANSIYVSFSSILQVAAHHATSASGEGLILELNTENVELVESPDELLEAEWLVEGDIINLKPIFYVKLVEAIDGRNQYEFYSINPYH